MINNFSKELSLCLPDLIHYLMEEDYLLLMTNYSLEKEWIVLVVDLKVSTRINQQERKLMINNFSKVQISCFTSVSELSRGGLCTKSVVDEE